MSKPIIGNTHLTGNAWKELLGRNGRDKNVEPVSNKKRDIKAVYKKQ